MSIPNPDSISPASDVRQYTSFASDIDLTAEGGAPCRFLRVVGAGTLAIVTAGSDGATRTLTVADGWELPVQATVIKSATNVTSVTVGW